MQTIEMKDCTENKKYTHHCKLTYNDQIRRFIFNGTEFTELRGHISVLLSLPVDGFVLKYIDNESDLITLTSNEDLQLALELSDKILRLVVENSAVYKPNESTSTPISPAFSPTHGGFGNRGGGFGNHGHHGGHGGGYHGHHGGHGHGHGHGRRGGGFGPHHPHEHGPHEHGPHLQDHGWYTDKMDKAKARIQSKIEFFKTSLEQLPADDFRRQNYLMKINRLEGRLLRWDAVQDRKQCKKKHKEEKKEEKKWDKKLTPEAIQQVQVLKSQIGTLKPYLYQLRMTKKQKKSELELCLQSGQGDKEGIWNEILKLKESINDTRKQISSFKDQIHSFRG